MTTRGSGGRSAPGGGRGGLAVAGPSVQTHFRVGPPASGTRMPPSSWGILGPAVRQQGGGQRARLQGGGQRARLHLLLLESKTANVPKQCA